MPAPRKMILNMSTIMGVNPVPKYATMRPMAPIDVFISSTCYDLGDLRAELADYLKKHAFLVRMSEDYESEFEVNGRVDSIQSCLDNVEKADVVICILDRRYGPLLPNHHSYAGVSATHAELLHADKQSKPIFYFVRDKAFIEHDQIIANGAFVPRWIDKKSQHELAKLIADKKALTPGSKSNWVDQFKSSVDLKPIVLKRLITQFPAHVGAFALQHERIVRLYFNYRGNNDAGLIHGTFVNAGTGPALDVECGWNTEQKDSLWQTQGGVPIGGEIAPRDHGGPAFVCPRGKSDLILYCQYQNSSGNKYRVEAPMKWTNNGYKREGPEAFFAWIGDAQGQWIKVT